MISDTQRRIDRFLHASVTEFVLVGLILVSVALVVTEAVLEPEVWAHQWFRPVQDVLTGLFISELAVRFAIARKKKGFFRNYWIDILAVVPLVSAFRLLRLLRILRLVRAGILINRNLSRFSAAMGRSLGAQIGTFIVIGLIVMVGAVGIYLVEGGENAEFDSIQEALWWSFFTLVAAEPIGGEPTTDGGRLLTLLVMLGGVTLFAVLTGVVSAVLIQRLRSAMDFRALDLDELVEHVVICGWSREGSLILEELMADQDMRDTPVVIVAEFSEPPEKELQNLNLSQIYFHSGDYTTIATLEAVGIHEAAYAILLADSTRLRSDQDRDARTVLAALTIEKLNPNIYTCAQLLDRKNDVQLRVAGVEDVIVATELASHLIATSIRNEGSVEVLTELLTVQVGNQFYKVQLPDPWQGWLYWKALEAMKQQYDALLVAVERPGHKDNPMVNPPPDLVLETDDTLLVIARKPPQLKKRRQLR